MVESLILETTFLIDLEREMRRGQGPAQRFVKGREESRLYLSFTVAGELAAGKSLADRNRWEEFPLVTRNISHFRRVPSLTVIGYGS